MAPVSQSAKSIAASSSVARCTLRPSLRPASPSWTRQAAGSTATTKWLLDVLLEQGGLRDAGRVEVRRAGRTQARGRMAVRDQLVGHLPALEKILEGVRNRHGGTSLTAVESVRFTTPI